MAISGWQQLLTIFSKTLMVSALSLSSTEVYFFFGLGADGLANCSITTFPTILGWLTIRIFSLMEIFTTEIIRLTSAENFEPIKNSRNILNFESICFPNFCLYDPSLLGIERKGCRHVRSVEAQVIQIWNRRIVLVDLDPQLHANIN
jgi:hypothetical protein